MQPAIPKSYLRDYAKEAGVPKLSQKEEKKKEKNENKLRRRERKERKEAGVGDSTFSKRRWKYFKAHPFCYWCEIMVSFQNSTLDHVLPKSKGGDNSKENTVLSCIPCNYKKGNAVWMKLDGEILVIEGKSRGEF